MPFPFITGKAKEFPKNPAEVIPLPEAEKIDPSKYEMDDSLVDAVNVALLLGRPLLLTGKPGTGKTRLAYRVAWELGWGEPIRFDTKSTSLARDVLYRYNTLGRFHAAQTESGSQEDLDYLEYVGLGKAIVLSRKKDQVQKFLPPGFSHIGPKQSVVLIDEIDKAPRDFPNDLLLEVDEQRFRIPELGNEEIKAAEGFHPCLIITSNSEQNLPDAFLRRCIYYHIHPPTREKLIRIIRGRIPTVSPADKNSPLLDSTLDFFEKIHKDLSLRKKPATAELLDWLQTLQGYGVQDSQELHQVSQHLQNSLGTLAKTQEDLAVLHTWVAEKKYLPPS